MLLPSTAARPPVHPPYRSRYCHAYPCIPSTQSPAPPCISHDSHHIIPRTTKCPPVHRPYSPLYRHALLITPTTPFPAPPHSLHQPHLAVLGALKRPFYPPVLNSGPRGASSPVPFPSRGYGQAQRPFGCTRRRSPVGSHPIHCNAGGVAAPSPLLADSATPGVTQGNTPVTAVTGPPAETPVPWEYPTGVWALLPWSGRPMIPHCSMRRPGAGGVASHLHLNLVCGGSTAQYEAGTTCHIALAFTLRLPLPHNQAMRRPLPLSCYRRCAQHMDVSKHIHPSHTRSSIITIDSHSLLTRSTVMPQPKNPRVTIQSRPPQQ